MVVAPGEHRPPVPGGDLGAVLERLKGVDGHGVDAVKAELLAKALSKSQKILKIERFQMLNKYYFKKLY